MTVSSALHRAYPTLDALSCPAVAKQTTYPLKALFPGAQAPDIGEWVVEIRTVPGDATVRNEVHGWEATVTSAELRSTGHPSGALELVRQAYHRARAMRYAQPKGGLVFKGKRQRKVRR
jgi:hypothetical protein